MWVLWMLVGFAVLLWSGCAWAYALTHKYEHTKESRIILGLTIVVSFILGWKTVVALGPGWSVPVTTFFSLIAGFAYFTGISYLLVSVWCSLLTREFDEKMAALEEEQDVLTRKMTLLRWQLVSGVREGTDKSFGSQQEVQSDQGREEKKRSLEEFIENWQKGGGTARVRALKIQEWKEEATRMDKNTILAEINAATSRIQGENDPVKKELEEVRLAILRLENLSRFSKEEGASVPPVKDEKEFSGTSLDEARIRDRLQEIHRETQMIDALKREFLRGKIRLSWRGRR